MKCELRKIAFTPEGLLKALDAAKKNKEILAFDKDYLEWMLRKNIRTWHTKEYKELNKLMKVFRKGHESLIFITPSLKMITLKNKIKMLKKLRKMALERGMPELAIKYSGAIDELEDSIGVKKHKITAKQAHKRLTKVISKIKKEVEK
jgi:hypothetical protein